MKIKKIDGTIIWEGEAETVLQAVQAAIASGANLVGANLDGANLDGANLIEANLIGASLRWAKLGGANLVGANLVGANLRWANLGGAKLSGADFSGADLSRASLRWASLVGANLVGANLVGANLVGADLRLTDLRGAIGLPLASEFLVQFERDAEGLIVFRPQPGDKFVPGTVLTEALNHCRVDECGSGVHFSTLEWARKNHVGPYWRCRIAWADLADVCVPYHAGGKARCARLTLLEIV
jgi:hypothetical protein